MAETNKQIFLKKFEEMKLTVTNNLFKIFVVACNEEMGIGKNRMTDILENVAKKVEIMNDDDFILVEEKCKRILGMYLYKKYFIDIPFKALPEDFNFIKDV